MSDLQARIAAIIDTHTAVGAEGQVTCWCDSQQFDSFHAHSLHAADAVIAELGLTRVTRSQNPPIHRYVTDWKAATTPPGYWYDKDGTKADDE